MTAFSVRRAVVLVAALCMALLGLLGSAPAVSASPDKPSDQQTGLSEFGSCLSGGGKGSLVMLMDQSGSLQKTDPDKARVTAAQYLAARLASFSTTKGITLDVRVAGFASSYAGAGDWTSLTPDALETVKRVRSAPSAMTSRITTRTTGTRWKAPARTWSTTTPPAVARWPGSRTESMTWTSEPPEAAGAPMTASPMPQVSRSIPRRVSPRPSGRGRPISAVRRVSPISCAPRR